MNRSTPGLPVHHQLPELVQTHVHRVGDAIQPSHPLSSPSPSPSALKLSQHRGLFKWVSSLHQVAKLLRVSASVSVFPMNIQDLFPLGWTGCISLQSKGLSKVFSNTTIQKHQFFCTQLYVHVYRIYKVNIFQCKIYNWIIVTILSGQGSLNRERLNSSLPGKVGLLKINIFCSLAGSFVYMRQEKKNN